MKLFYILYYIFAFVLISCSGHDDGYDNQAISQTECEVEPRIKSMEFHSKDNSQLLINDVVCNIAGDSIITCRIPHFMQSKKLVPRVDYEGDEIRMESLGGAILVSGNTCCDFSKPVKLVVIKGDKRKNYLVFVQAYTGLPVCWIETEGRVPIESKDNYVNATFRLVEDVVTRGGGDVFEDSVQIKGRGNITWKKFPKKSYRLKFAEKVSLLGEPKDKSWVLLANYADKTMLRNDLTFFMGQISSLEYTPSSHFVEVMLNGSYQGTYQLTDKLKISKNRVDVGDDGFLLEIDDYAPYEEDARYFKVNYLAQPCINIKDPEVEYDDDNYVFIKQFVLKAEEVLFSDSFLDKDNGWQKYLDINSFVDYYIINEITKNTDAMWSSSFMNLIRGGILKMGPLWDYDLAYGNYSGIASMADYDGFRVKTNPWYSRLFEDPTFISRVKERYDYFYNQKQIIAERINAIANYLEYSALENNNKWNVLYLEGWPNVSALGSYQNEVFYLKEWLFKRMDWLKSQYDKM